jgi:hypothetical protein
MKVLQGYKISATADLQDSSSLIIVEDPWKWNWLWRHIYISDFLPRGSIFVAGFLQTALIVYFPLLRYGWLFSIISRSSRSGLVEPTLMLVKLVSTCLYLICDGFHLWNLFLLRHWHLPVCLWL